MKTEIWNGHKIRFVEVNGDWWAVAKDVANALGYKHTPHMIRNLDKQDTGVHKVDSTYEVVTTARKAQDMVIISEFGIYDAVFRSNKPEAKEFKRWVFKVIKELRKSVGFEGFQVFRMLDKEHQKEAMCTLSKGLRNPVRVDFMKANVIANKAVSNKYGYPKLIKKGEMTPEMLVDRQSILEDTVELMAVRGKYGLDISVSEKIYKNQ